MVAVRLMSRAVPQVSEPLTKIAFTLVRSCSESLRVIPPAVLHGAVGLGNYIWLTLSRQQPEGLFILFLELGLSSLSVFQGAVVNAGGSNFDAIVLEDALGCSRKGMFAAEVGEHPLQTKGSPPWSDADSLGKDTQVVRAQVAPDLFAHRDFPKDRAPFQRFFLRLRTVGSLALSSSATR